MCVCQICWWVVILVAIIISWLLWCITLINILLSHHLIMTDYDEGYPGLHGSEVLLVASCVYLAVHSENQLVIVCGRP